MLVITADNSLKHLYIYTVCIYVITNSYTLQWYPGLFISCFISPVYFHWGGFIQKIKQTQQNSFYLTVSVCEVKGHCRYIFINQVMTSFPVQVRVIDKRYSVYLMIFSSDIHSNTFSANHKTTNEELDSRAKRCALTCPCWILVHSSLLND